MNTTPAQWEEESNGQAEFTPSPFEACPSWKASHRGAARYASEVNLPVMLRKVKQYGVTMFVYSLWCANDAQMGEIVRPGDPE